MPTHRIRRGATLLPGESGKADSSPIYVDSDSNEMKFVPASTGTTEKTFVDTDTAQTLTSKTLTSPVLTTPVISSPVVNNAVVATTASTLAVTAALHDGKTVVLTRALGIAVTLPVASGSGLRVRFTVGLALSGGSHVIAVADNTDYMRGLVVQSQDGGATVQAWETASTGTLATESDTITLDGTTKGGLIGDLIELEDIATDVWRVTGILAGTSTEASPFSAAV